MRLGMQQQVCRRACLVMVLMTCTGCLAAAQYPITTADVVTEETAIEPADLGTCICDLTVGACDGNCCCDPSCTDAVKTAVFSCDCTTKEGCEEEGPRSVLPQACVSSSTMASTEQLSLVDEQFCVVTNNNPSLGTYFPDMDVVASEAFETSLSVAVTTAATRYTAPPTLGSVYQVGDRVTGVYQASTPGGAALPAAGFGGACSDQNPIRYMRDASQTCLRASATLSAAVCSNTFSSTIYVDELKVGATPAAAATVTIDQNNDLTVCSGGSCAAATSVTAVAYVAGAPDTCTNGVTGVDYVIEHDGAGTIAKVLVTVTLATVSADVAFTEQSFSVTWRETGAPATVRSRSGNQGYRFGQPVLVGVATTTASNEDVIRQLVSPQDRMQVMRATSTGTCDRTLTQDVLFGQDVISSCAMQQTYASIATCATLQTNAAAFMQPIANQTSVALWGSSDYHNPFHWTEITQVPATGSNTDGAGECTLTTSLDYEILYVPQGATNNVQWKIVGARARLQNEQFVFPCIGEYCSALLTTQTAPIELRSSVTFVNVASEAASQVVPPAPTLFSLSDDLFYPFSAAPQHAPAPVASLLLPTLLMLLLLVCLASP